MQSNSSRVAELVVTGVAFGESLRWHDHSLWLSDMHGGQVLEVRAGAGGGDAYDVHMVCEVPSSPSGLGWTPDGRLLVVSMTDRRVLRREHDGTIVEHADLSSVATFHCNDMVVDGRGNAYVGNFGSDYVPGVKRSPATLALVRLDGSVAVAAEDLGFPNGAAVTRDGKTLIIAESMRRQLTAFTISDDGTLQNRRVWADLGHRLPDGLVLDAEGAVWFADPRARSCVRVREGGGILEEVTFEVSCYACTLGGPDRRTLFVALNPSEEPQQARDRRDGSVVALEVSVPGAGWP